MTNSFHGAIILLNTTPDDDTVDSIAKDVVDQYFPDHKYVYRLTKTLPDGVPVDMADQYTAEMRDLPRGSTYLVVHPVENTNSST